MTEISRKAFLRLMAAAATATAFNSRPSGETSSISAQGSSKESLLIRGADLLTMDPVLKEVPAADVLVQGGRIAGVGRGLPATGADVVDARGMILMPGLCDGHRHVWEIIDAGRLAKTQPQRYASYQEWKMRTIVSLTPDDNYLAGFVGGLMAIDSGVTSIVDYAHGQPTAEKALAAARGIRDSGIGGWFAFQLGVSSSYGPGETVSLSAATRQRVATATESHWKTVERLQKEVFSDSAAPMQLGLAPAGGVGRPVEQIKAEWARARATGVRLLAAHVHKPARPLPPGVMGHRDSGIPDLYEAGLLGPDYHLSHGNRLTAEELKMIRDTGGMICATAMGEFPYMANPTSGASIHGRARAAGVSVGIGIDVPIVLTNDYFEHARAAFWNLYLDPEGVKIAESYKSEDVLDFVTALGSKALRLGDVTGSISVGKRADLVLLRTDRIGFAIQGSLADRVLNFATTTDVDSVWIAGKPLKRNGKMVGVDWAKLKAQVRDAQARFGPQAASITFTS
ncbi:MAG TPA: amidohydrolase family protein [Vicinamibacterales bacterium]|nr:amidohydrolase family protein [Vicinamibacterales bacterium]